MAISDINLGGSPNDGTGSTLREGGAIVNLILDMWNTVTGGISYIAGNVGINVTPTLGTLHVDGTVAIRSDSNHLKLFESDESDKHWDVGINDSKLTITEIGVADRFIIDTNGKIDIGNLAVSGLPVYANNAAALVGGLTAGDFYKTASTGDATVMVTNAT